MEWKDILRKIAVGFVMGFAAGLPVTGTITNSVITGAIVGGIRGLLEVVLTLLEPKPVASLGGKKVKVVKHWTSTTRKYI
jgi:hypothetical protein